ncbi:hypothetical protein GY45DRAFT_1163753 [Cubamyces sp. BRFM 1775]|nr:hypothetical protein GY45DRAFT_1163753 [Cubamyces sp. BRFM 1775]
MYRKIEAKLPYPFSSGGITHFHPLCRGSWVVVCKTEKLYLGQVIILYTKGDMILSPLTVSISGALSPDSPSFLYLHQEQLITSLDAQCPNAVQSTIDLQPGLPMLTVDVQLVEHFRKIEEQSRAICTAVESLQKEKRRRGKRTGDATQGEENGPTSGGTAAKRSRA